MKPYHSLAHHWHPNLTQHYDLHSRSCMLNKYCEKSYITTERRQNSAPNLDCGLVDFTGGWRGFDRWSYFGKDTQKFYHCPQESDDDQYCPWSPGKCSHLQHYRNSQGEWVKCVGAAGRAYRWSGKYRTIRTGTSYAMVKGPRMFRIWLNLFPQFADKRLPYPARQEYSK